MQPTSGAFIGRRSRMLGARLADAFAFQFFCDEEKMQVRCTKRPWWQEWQCVHRCTGKRKQWGSERKCLTKQPWIENDRSRLHQPHAGQRRMAGIEQDIPGCGQDR